MNDGTIPLRCGADKCASHGGVVAYDGTVDDQFVSHAQLLPGLQQAARVREERELAPALSRPVLLGSHYDAI